MAKVAQGRKQGPLEPCAQITSSEASALSNSLRCRGETKARGQAGSRSREGLVAEPGLAPAI